ncbi:hypothetical protein AK812_SmicGene4745 [Symbiodinium microadriaticum]|uniref:Uncharacterized protein n=1 Tax=Symbiodinium microadriaticum TaxID=2951 RepID=A0A1Q9EVG5_SYMMI|nr:hypothetical protein AK812_SmicGene4745 [Symbiodinium microadriaticum]
MSHVPRPAKRKAEQTPGDEQRDGVSQPSSAVHARYTRRRPTAPRRPQGPGPFGPPPPEPMRRPDSDTPAAPARDDASSNDEDSLDSALLSPDMGSQDGIEDSSSFEMVLEGDDLDNAKARLSTLYRAELAVLFPHRSTRSFAGKMSWFQRDTAACSWDELQEKARHYLSNERYADWDNWKNGNARGHRHAGARVSSTAVVEEGPGLWDLPGDFNAQLTAQRPHVGTTCCQPGEGQDREQRRAQQQPSCPNLRFDKIALLPAVQTNNDQAQALQSTVHQELAKIESTELHQVRNSINSALLEAVEKHFPQPKPDDNRLSAQGGFRASAKHTWQLYKEMKAAHTVTAHSVFRQWQATVTFMKASQALRAQSRHLKKASVLHKLAEAETAACKGDQRVLYQIVRSLTPHKHQFLSRLRESQGRLLDKTASLQAMLQYARDTFSVHADDPAELSMTAGLAITDQAVQQAASLASWALRCANTSRTFPSTLTLSPVANLTALLQQQEMQDAQLPVDSRDIPCCDGAAIKRGLSNPRKEQEAEVDSSEANGSTQPPKRPRPEPNLLMASRQSATSNPRRQPRTPKGQSLSAEARLMARLMLYHEDQLAAQRMDKDFVLFMRQDYASIIPNLHAISVEWHAKKEEGVENLTSSLRTLLLACLVKELLARVQKMASTQEGQEKLQRTKWMDLDQQWTFLRWCHKTKKLVVDDNKPSLSHTELVRQLTFLLENLRGDVIHKFHSTKGLDLVEENASNLPSVTFLLGISLRGERAHEMHEVLCKLLGCSAWQLIGVSLKREGLQRAPAAKQLAKMLYGK